eukprot:3961705-Pleurochrysis_carterae.AAC.1
MWVSIGYGPERLECDQLVMTPPPFQVILAQSGLWRSLGSGTVCALAHEPFSFFLKTEAVLPVCKLFSTRCEYATEWFA